MAAIVPALAKIGFVIGDILIQPALSASLLALISYGPADLVSRISELGLLQNSIGLGGLRAVLKLLLSLGLIRATSRLFDVLALNNWRISSKKDWEWNKEVAVITGGCNGIGKAIVIGLVEKGVKVAILDYADLPSDLAEMDAVSYWKCDVTSESAIAEAADGIRETLGHPSILINNAGVAGPHSILETSQDDLKRIFGINVISHWSTTKQFLPAMISKNKGHVVTVSSLMSYVPLPKVVDYAATKAGIMAFHQGLSCEIKHLYKAPAIMTTIVHPMWVETGMTKRQAAKSEATRKKMMQPDFVARKVLDQLFSCRSGQIFLPENATWLTGINAFPNWLQVSIRDLGGKAATQ
ncbi:estradiol 17-beta-dehydrogenase [Ilyonectria robusta]|uniref:estradiol 17-beta-dehydrogenase n=1 Tax=Ilyonectria robusta TaxID=1079257 RepID=UPI001E8D97E1|nr:estradiol 17-beta-dehydrogenase [Ilyonectria robusta]KAH8721782.1 estradiol 17-beta-dehydrogenase [Ilyonectria robusta]